MRQTTPLNFEWLFGRYEEGYQLSTHDDTDLVKVDIPHSNVTFPFNHFNEQEYQFVSVYKKTVVFTKEQGRRYHLKFEGVLHQYTLYVNDQEVGSHASGYTAHTFDITRFVKSGENHLALVVDSRETLNQPPFGKTIDFLTYGGIYREIELIETPDTFIEKASIHADFSTKVPTITIDLTTSSPSDVTVVLQQNKKQLVQSTFQVGQDITFTYPVERWDIDHPVLYDVVLQLSSGDEKVITTGFKEQEFRSDGFYLNGKKQKIIGLNRHQTYPNVGYAMPKSAQVLDATLLKEMGNAVRTSHYPQSRHFLDACDELGLLVFIEAPGWQHIGDDTWKEYYQETVADMIEEHRHHPSIILWGVRVNESGDDHDLYTATNDLARALDNRPTGGVRCFAFSEPLEDVYTYNDFFHNGSNDYLKQIDEVIDHDKPYLITEFNGHMFPTKSFDPPMKQVEHAMRYAHILNELYKNDRIAGGFGWNFSDYYTHNEFGSGDHICYHGVLDVNRLHKPAAHIYRSQYAVTPYLKVLHSMDIGDYNVGYIPAMHVATNCDYIDLYQNDRYVSRYYPDQTRFSHLPHPPVIIDDLFGTAFEQEGYSKKEANEIRKLANLIASRGGLDKITKADNLDSSKLKQAWDFYGKYVANWGSKAFTYTLIGHYKDQQIKQMVGPHQDLTYRITTDSNKLYHGATYDVTRIVIEAVDQHQMPMQYAFDPFQIEVEGSIAIIGESLVSLYGGKRSIWIRSKKVGTGTVTIHNHRTQKALHFDVVKQ